MTAIGGSLESVIINGRFFAVAADADTQRNIGGYSNEVLVNGDGSARMTKTRIPWKKEGISLEVDDTRGDHEFLQNSANLNDFFPLVVTYTSGISYQGTGQIRFLRLSCVELYLKEQKLSVEVHPH